MASAGKGAALRLDLNNSEWVMFRDFRDLTAPLALLEHLTEKA